MAYRLSPRARDDLKSIRHYIRKNSGKPEVARHFCANLLAKCKELSEHYPFLMGQLRPELATGCRSYVFGNYSIFFRYAGDVMEIIAIIEGHRDIQTLFSHSTS